jgi:hypothetical protein
MDNKNYQSKNKSQFKNNNKIRTELLDFLDKENQEYINKTQKILFNHKKPKDIIKEFEIFQIKLVNPTINFSLKYHVEATKNQNNVFKRQNSNMSNNDYTYEIPNNFRAEFLQKKKITCSFRKLKNKEITDPSKLGVKKISSEENFIQNITPFSTSNHYNNSNSINNNNSNNNNSLNTFSTLTEKKKSFYRSRSLTRSTTSNNSNFLIKLFLTEEEKRAKKIERGFETLNKLALSLKNFDNKISCKNLKLIKYEELFDILEYRGMEKEKEIIDKKIQKNIKKKINSNLNKIEEEDQHHLNSNDFNKINYETNFHTNIKLSEKDLKISDDEMVTFDKEKFFKLAQSTKNIDKNSKNEFNKKNNNNKILDESNKIHKIERSNFTKKIEKNTDNKKSSNSNSTSNNNDNNNNIPSQQIPKNKTCKKKLSFMKEGFENLIQKKQNKEEFSKNLYKISDKDNKFISQTNKNIPPKKKNNFNSRKLLNFVKVEDEFTLKSKSPILILNHENKKFEREEKDDYLSSPHKISDESFSNKFNETEKQKILKNLEIYEKSEKDNLKEKIDINILEEKNDNKDKNSNKKFNYDTYNNNDKLNTNNFYPINKNNYSNSYNSSNLRYRSNSNNIKNNFDTTEINLEYKQDLSQGSNNSIISNNSIMLSNIYNLNSLIEYNSDFQSAKFSNKNFTSGKNYVNYEFDNYKSVLRKLENDEFKNDNILKILKKSKTNISESSFISDFSKNSKLSIYSQNNNMSIITKSSISDLDI